MKTNTNTNTDTSTTSYTQASSPRIESGWLCRRCGRINAPWVRQCDCSRNNWSITCDDTTADDEWWKKSADTFRIHPEEMAIYTTAHNSTVGGSDYLDKEIWTNILKNVSNIKEIY